MPVDGSANHEATKLMDAIHSLQALHEKSRLQNYALNNNHLSDSLSEASDTTPNTFNGASEHRRKIRELTIALEAQAMDETRHFALQSPMTDTQIKTPRVTPVPGTVSQIKGLPKTAKAFLNDAAAVRSSSSACTNANPKLSPRNEIKQPCPIRENEQEGDKCVGEVFAEEKNSGAEEKKPLTLDEQRKRMESLTRELDAQLNAAIQAQAFHKTNPYAAQTSKNLSNGTKDVKHPKNVEVAAAETLSTELDTTVASSSKRDMVSTSTSGSEGGRNGIIVLDNKEDFEDEHTHFEAPLSPNSFFVKSTSPPKHTSNRKTYHTNTQVHKYTLSKKTDKASHHDAISSNPFFTIEMVVSPYPTCHSCAFQKISLIVSPYLLHFIEKDNGLGYFI